MADVIRRIKFKRGLKANLPTLATGEPGFVTDEGELYIGTDSGNVKLTSKSELADSLTNNIPSVIIDDTDVNITYSGTWTGTTDINYYGKTKHTSNTTNAYIQFSFTGTGIEVYDTTGNNRGNAEVFIDNVSQGIFDRYTASMAYNQLLFSATGLSKGTHTIKIVVKGTKNASSSDVYLGFDYFKVLNQSSITYNYQKIADRMPTYESLIWLVNSPSKAYFFDVFQTLGFYTKDDGGGGQYRVVGTSGTETWTQINGLFYISDSAEIKLDADKKLVLIPSGVPIITQLGAKSDDSTDDTVVVQKVLDNYKAMQLPTGRRTLVTSLNTKGITIYGNNSSIKSTNTSTTPAIFTRVSGNIVAHDLIVYSSGSDFFNASVVGAGNSDGMYLRLYNAILYGTNKLGTGVIMRQNDFSCLRDVTMWYVDKGVKIISDTGERTSTQIIFDNIGLSNVNYGFELQGGDKVTLHNCDIMHCTTGFTVQDKNKRLKFMNCHVEYFADKAYTGTSNVQNDDVSYENCSALYPDDTATAGFYWGVRTTYGVSGLRYVNCRGAIPTNPNSFYIFNINSPVYFNGLFDNSSGYYKFVSSSDSIVNSRLDLEQKPPTLSTTVLNPVDSVSFNTTGATGLTITANDVYNDIAWSGGTVYKSISAKLGWYTFIINGYSKVGTVFIQLQEEGGSWTTYATVRSNIVAKEQKFHYFFPTDKAVRLNFVVYAQATLTIQSVQIIRGIA